MFVNVQQKMTRRDSFAESVYLLSDLFRDEASQSLGVDVPLMPSIC